MALTQHCFVFSKYSSTITYNDLPKNITTPRAQIALLLPFSKTSLKLGVVKCSANSITTPKPKDKSRRRTANYKPSSWNYDFLESLNNNDLISDTITKDRANKLIEEVRRMIKYEDDMPLSTLELIDDIQRLGLGYHFEDDITLVLHRYSSLLKNGNNIHKFTTLHSSALIFRLLRQHGFVVSQDIFNGFKDEQDNFKACLNKDVKGMLSLYEASYLALEGENLLDKANEFTTLHLNNLKPEDVDKHQFEEVNHALELPLHHRMLRLQARWYIEAYSKRPDTNQLLLEAATLDFNFVQLTHQRELQEISRWWQGLAMANKLSFSRDRVMECFFWAMGMVFEPQYSYLRKGLTKICAFITVIDDVYDVYGTLDELELFTYAVERWDVNVVNVLPDYMKLCFLALLNTVNDMAYDVLKKQGNNILPYVTKAWADVLRGYLQEAKWSHNKQTPKFEEYLENGWISVSGVVLLVHGYCLLSQNITKKGLECIQNYHNLLRWPSVIFRLCNDLGTSKAELERGETASSLTCIMKQTSISEESARGYLKILIQKNWKKLNRAVIVNDDDDSIFSKPFVRITMNLARIAQCTYQYGDGHGDPDARSIKRISSLLVDPIF